MMEVERELDSRYDDIDVDSILARCERRGPLTFSRKRCLYQAPEFIKRLPAAEEVEEGSTVTFGCKVVGFPKPKVAWFKDDEIIGSDARARFDSEESGIHSITFSDVSKCDAGIYKIRASNLEGSSTSMLYITVKAKAKLRNRKKAKRPSRMVALAPLFPAIVEHVAEEQKETLEIAHQPPSPLTPLYCTISRKSPVMWPAFLGDWAYNSDDMLNRSEIEEMDLDCEDVFDDETTNNTATAHNTSKKMEEKGIENTTHSEHKLVDIGNNVNEEHRDRETGKCKNDEAVSKLICNGKVSINTADNAVRQADDSSKRNEYKDENKNTCSKTICDILNNNNKANENSELLLTDTVKTKMAHTIPPRELEERHVFYEPDFVSAICVHRSYAKGDSTSSVAKRSPSPLSRRRVPITHAQNGTYSIRPIKNETRHFSDKMTLHSNSSEQFPNQRHPILSLACEFWRLFVSFMTSSNWEDCLLEVILLVCGSTFMALCLDLPPSSFIVYILKALLVKFIVTSLLEDT